MGRQYECLGNRSDPEPANSGWGTDDIDRFIVEGYSSVTDKPPVFLIAALWVPNYGVTMSSSANYFYTARSDMTNTGPTVAPRWYQAVWNVNSVTGTTISVHAEDGACYLFEKSLQRKLGPDDKYPGTDTQRPYVVVYGIRRQGNTPGFVACCAKSKPGGSNLVGRPDCTSVMNSLGIDMKL